MATQPMTLSQIIQNIQLNTLNDPTLPATTSQEFLVAYTFLTTLGVGSWENERDMLWNELWVDEPNYATIGVNQTTITLPDDFKFMYDGTMRLTLTGSTTASPNVLPIKIKSLSEKSLNYTNTAREAYIQGNIVNGFELVLGWTPQAGDTEIGATVSFRYYKYAALPTSINDSSWTPEMSDPMFIVYKVSAAIGRNNYNMNAYQVNEDLANYSLSNMRTANDMTGNFQEGYVKDVDVLLGRGVPGRRDRYNSSFWSGQ